MSDNMQVLVSSGEYVRVYDCDRGCYIFEHDKVWLDANGYKHLRSITEYEDGSYVVHHINGNRSDNRLENLQLLTRAEHASLHSKYRDPSINKKISATLTGIKRSDETRNRMSAYRKLNPSRGMLGKHHTDSAKKRISESGKLTWSNKSDEDKKKWRKLISDKKRGRVAVNKGVPCPQHQKDFLSSYWKKQYEDGYTPPSLGRIFVTNGSENHQIYPNELEKYETLGYWRGITRKKDNDKK